MRSSAMADEECNKGYGKCGDLPFTFVEKAY
jgi:hypothetical protein